MKIFSNDSIPLSQYNISSPTFEDVSSFSLDLLRKFHQSAHDYFTTYNEYFNQTEIDTLSKLIMY